MTKHIYLVTQNGNPRLIRASGLSLAKFFAARSTIKARTATTEEVEQLLLGGTLIEEAEKISKPQSLPTPQKICEIRSPETLDSSLNDEALLRVSELTNSPGKPGLLGFSRASLYRLLDEPGAFPKPVRPLPGIVAFRAGDVRAWLKSKVAN